MSKTYTVQVRDKTTTFTHIGVQSMPDFSEVTAVAVIPFNADGTIIAVNLFHRGYDLPGGHVESFDKTPIDTACRETMEEAMITLKDLVLVEVIHSDYFDDRSSYLLIYAARVDEILPFEENEESSERLSLTTEEFIAGYTVGNKDIVAEVIERARNAVLPKN